MIFVSYSKSDYKWRDILLTHLKGYSQDFVDDYVWVDSKIRASDYWNDELEKKRNDASIAILLVSPDYLSSAFIREKELDYFLAKKDVKIFWFLIASCAWEEKELKEIQCANIKRGKRLIPLVNCKSIVDDIFNEKSKEIYYLAIGKDPSVQNRKILVVKNNIQFANERYTLLDNEGKTIIISTNSSLDELKTAFKNSKEQKKLLKDITDVLKSKTDNKSKVLLKKIDELASVYPEEEVNNDDIFELLTNVDFKEQEEKFKKYITKRKFHAFIIKGDGICGQRWLLGQLINKYIRNNDRLISGGNVNMDSESIIDEMMKELGCEMISNKFAIKCDMVIKKLMDRLETRDQILIFKNSYNFINSASFPNFYDKFIDKLNNAVFIQDKSNKIIFFFVEEVPFQYKNNYAMNCFYFDKADNESTKKFNEDYIRDKDNIKVIGLHSIGKIDYHMIDDWCTDFLTLSSYSGMDFSQEFYNKNCEDGNAEKVMYSISKKFKYENQWLKY